MLSSHTCHETTSRTHHTRSRTHLWCSCHRRYRREFHCVHHHLHRTRHQLVWNCFLLDPHLFADKTRTVSTNASMVWKNNRSILKGSHLHGLFRLASTIQPRLVFRRLPVRYHFKDSREIIDHAEKALPVGLKRTKDHNL